MPFKRPTLAELIEHSSADFISRLSLKGAVLRRAVVRVFAKVFAGSVHGVHGHIEWASRQIHAHSADAEELERHGAEWGIPRKLAAYAGGAVTFSGADGAVIPAGTLLQRQDGVEYFTQADGAISGGSVVVTVKSRKSGVSGNAEVGTALSLVSPIAGVQSAATVASGGITNGADIEGIETYRARILQRKRNPPQGGNATDYQRWASEVAGVTRAWVYPGHVGAGSVGVTFVMDEAEGIIPDAAKVAEVQAYIDAPDRRPTTADVVVFAPVAVPLNLSIQLTPNTAAVRAAVEAEIKDMLNRDAEPGGIIYLSRIREAISIAAGEINHVLSAPVANVTHATGQIAVMGVITWL